jgi:hypothetical protein
MTGAVQYTQRERLALVIIATLGFCLVNGVFVYAGESAGAAAECDDEPRGRRLHGGSAGIDWCSRISPSTVAGQQPALGMVRGLEPGGQHCVCAAGRSADHRSAFSYSYVLRSRGVGMIPAWRLEDGDVAAASACS